MDFKQFDFVTGKCHDGYEFVGLITEISDHYVLINGYGFPIDMIKEMNHA